MMGIAVLAAIGLGAFSLYSAYNAYKAFSEGAKSLMATAIMYFLASGVAALLALGWAIS